MLRITHEEKGKQFHFLRSLAAEPDYSSQIIEKAVEVLRSKAILDETSIQEFESMNEEVRIVFCHILVWKHIPVMYCKKSPRFLDILHIYKMPICNTVYISLYG